MSHESLAQLQAALAKVAAWEKAQNDLWFWEKLGRLPFMLLDKLTPKFLQAKIGQALDEIGHYVQSGGQYLASEQTVLQKLNERVEAYSIPSVATLQEAAKLPLAVMNETVNNFTNSRAKLATVQGASTGFGGIFTLAIDIPALLGLSLKVLQEIAMSYGYDPKDERERVFIVKCLQFSSSDIVGKKAIQDELSSFDTQKGYSNGLAQLQGWREVIYTYRDNFGWKKLFQLVPIAGMLFGAWFNRGTIQDVAEAGAMLYRKRRILERIQALNK